MSKILSTLLVFVFVSAYGQLIYAGQQSTAPANSDSPEIQKSKSSEEESDNGQADPADGVKWIDLFNDRNLDNWSKTNFGGEGRIIVADKKIEMEMGAPITGLTFQKTFPNDNFEIELEANKTNGSDFFCALTFPVDESFCTFVVGGWGGTVVGLSNIDNQDASENATTRYIKFEKNQWYKIRVCVADQKIKCWIDDQQVVDQTRVDKKIGVRPEVELSCPLGICAFETAVELRNIRYRKLKGSSDLDKSAEDESEEEKPEQDKSDQGADAVNDAGKQTKQKSLEESDDVTDKAGMDGF